MRGDDDGEPAPSRGTSGRVKLDEDDEASEMLARIKADLRPEVKGIRRELKGLLEEFVALQAKRQQPHVARVLRASYDENEAARTKLAIRFVRESICQCRATLHRLTGRSVLGARHPAEAGYELCRLLRRAMKARCRASDLTMEEGPRDVVESLQQLYHTCDKRQFQYRSILQHTTVWGSVGGLGEDVERRILRGAITSLYNIPRWLNFVEEDVDRVYWKGERRRGRRYVSRRSPHWRPDYTKLPQFWDEPA